MSDQSDVVSIELDGDVAVIRFDDGKANALSHEMLDALIAAVDRGAAEAKAIALIGRPGKFSAGFHLPTVTAGPEAARGILAKGAELSARIFTAPVPVVIGCTGHALAMGAILLLSADVRIGTDAPSKIGLNEVAIGMAMPTFVIELARQYLAPNRLQHAIQLATVTDSAGALEAGFLDRVVADDEVAATAVATAAQLAGGLHPGAFRLTRQRVRGEAAARVAEALKEDLASFRIED